MHPLVVCCALLGLASATLSMASDQRVSLSISGKPGPMVAGCSIKAGKVFCGVEPKAPLPTGDTVVMSISPADKHIMGGGRQITKGPAHSGHTVARKASYGASREKEHASSERSMHNVSPNWARARKTEVTAAASNATGSYRRDSCVP